MPYHDRKLLRIVVVWMNVLIGWLVSGMFYVVLVVFGLLGSVDAAVRNILAFLIL